MTNSLNKKEIKDYEYIRGCIYIFQYLLAVKQKDVYYYYYYSY